VGLAPGFCADDDAAVASRADAATSAMTNARSLLVFLMAELPIYLFLQINMPLRKSGAK
jgi:hypothetical protein